MRETDGVPSGVEASVCDCSLSSWSLACLVDEANEEEEGVEGAKDSDCCCCCESAE